MVEIQACSRLLTGSILSLLIRFWPLAHGIKIVIFYVVNYYVDDKKGTNPKSKACNRILEVIITYISISTFITSENHGFD